MCAFKSVYGWREEIVSLDLEFCSVGTEIQQEFVLQLKGSSESLAAFQVCTCEPGGKRKRQGSLCIIVLVLSPPQDKVRAVCVCVCVHVVAGGPSSDS